MIDGTPKAWYPLLNYPAPLRDPRLVKRGVTSPICMNCGRRRKSDRHVCEGGNPK